nr:phenylpropanoid glycosyltransferase UGT16 [Artemisia annua]
MPNSEMALEASQEHSQLHFLVIPVGSPGHYIPTIDIAKLLAQHGVRVTIVTTPANNLRFGSILDQAIERGLPISFLEFPFRYAEFGLPEGCESVDDLPNLGYGKALMQAYDSLQKEVEQYIEKLNQKPDCIVSDTFLLWPGETAKKFQIPRVIFDGMNCFTQLCNHILDVSKVHESVGESESFVVPGLPDRIELTRSQLPFTFNPGSRDRDDFKEKLKISEAEAYGVVINSFRELEPAYADEYQKVKGDKVWCIGPLSLCHKDESEKVQRGNKSSINKNEFLKWLDSQEKGSVIYACLGSLSRIEPAQLVELALALEASKKPFIWVVRAGPKTDKIEKWIENEGFEERTKERGLLIRGWAPQLLVLSHPAIGGFLTHCGWNSILEGLSAGVPMVTWPQFQEQFYNEKLIVQVLRIGVSVGAQSVVHFGEEEKSGVVVKSDDFKNAIETLMEEGKEAKERSQRAKELGELANKAIEEGGSSHKNMTRLIEDIRNQAGTRK